MLCWSGSDLRGDAGAIIYLFDGAAGGAEGAAHETMWALLGMGGPVWHKDLQARPLVVMLGAASTMRVYSTSSEQPLCVHGS